MQSKYGYNMKNVNSSGFRTFVPTKSKNYCDNLKLNIAEAERRFRPQLLNYLANEKLPNNTWFSGELSHQEFLILKTKNNYIPVRPDFYIAKYGIVIEIDGSSHDNIDEKIIRNLYNTALLKELDIDVYRIPNDDVYNRKAISRHIKSIQRLICKKASDIDFKKKYQRRRKQLSRNRKYFLNTPEGQAFTQLRERDLAGKTKSKGYSQYKKYGGYVYLFNPQNEKYGGNK